MKRDEIIRDLQERAAGAGMGQYMTLRCDVAREIVALLKEQEARVLTKEEAVHYMSDEEAYEFSEKVPLYVEHKTPDEWDFKWARAETVYTWMCDLRMRQNYGITFRLWTSRPTDEQRKAATWDE